MIDLLPDEDQQALLDSFADFLRSEVTLLASPHRDLWDDIVPLGWLALALPEEDGGAGLDAIAETLLLREAGRYLATPSLMASLCGVRVTLACGRPDIAQEIARGEKRVALAVELNHDSAYLIDATDASWCLLLRDEGLELRPVASPLADTKAADDRIVLSIAKLGDAVAFHDDVQIAALMIAAQMTGIAEAVRDMAVEYAKVREQFGQPIGGFQAIKHACADLAIQAEASCAQLFLAAVTVVAGGEDAEREVAAALRVASSAAARGSETNIQIHGAMGTTEECHAHLYLKRANLLALLCGTQNWQKKALLAV